MVRSTLIKSDTAVAGGAAVAGTNAAYAIQSPRSLRTINKASAIWTRSQNSVNNSGKTAVLSAGSVRVVVRLRPLSQKEREQNHRNIIQVIDDNSLIFDPKEHSQAFFYHGVQQRGRDLLKKSNKNMQFVFDNVFAFESNNNDVFQATTQSLIQSLMDGYNCSVFAYGATGAGKTHTMVGTSSEPGITFLTMAELFKERERLRNERNFELSITYLEVYNEQVQDLLNPTGKMLQLREDAKYGVTVAGISVVKILNSDDLFKLLESGNANRTQHPTDANAESSRSHAVFQVYIQMEIRATGEMRASKLSMIDLAGSERGAATGFVGARFTEGANINKSLLALGNCINSLADGQRHVPYRDSKLTRLLKDSLGGNCQTIMIAAISPSAMSYEDTYNTLKYATRAKKIKTNMKRNVVNVELKASQYIRLLEDKQAEIERLKRQLAEYEATARQSCDCGAGGDANTVANTKLNSTYHVSDVSIPPAKSEADTVDDNSAGNDPTMGEFARLVQLKRCGLDRLYCLEMSHKTILLRRKLKEEADSRFSGLCSNTPEKKEGHRRLGNMLTRFLRQEETYKVEIASQKQVIQDIDNKLNELSQKWPWLRSKIDMENEKFEKSGYRHEATMERKRSDVLYDECKSANMLISKMADMLQMYHYQSIGHGQATKDMVNNYQQLIRDVQGRKTISWQHLMANDELTQLDMDATTTLGELGPTEKQPLENKPVIAKVSSSTVYKATPPRKCGRSPLGKRNEKENRSDDILGRIKARHNIMLKRLPSVSIRNATGGIGSVKSSTSVKKPPFRG